MNKELIARWLGGSNKGMSAITAKIALSKYRKIYPTCECVIQPLTWLSGKFEVCVYKETQ